MGFILLLQLVTFAGCGKVGAPASPSDCIGRGWAHFQIGEFSDAQEQFRAALASLPAGAAADDPRRLQALYGLAQTLDLGRRNEGGPSNANPLYQSVIAAAPSSDLAAWSMLAIARSHHLAAENPSDLPAVVPLYQNVVNRFPYHPAGEEAFLYLQTIRLLDANDSCAEEVLVSLQAFIGGHQSSKYLSAALSLEADAFDRLARPKDKLLAMERAFAAREIDPGNPRMDNADPYWSLATTAEFDAGDFATARKFYLLLRSQYPNDQRCFPAGQELRHMDLLEAQLRTTAASAAEKRP